jgi:hypothetical protein
LAAAVSRIAHANKSEKSIKKNQQRMPPLVVVRSLLLMSTPAGSPPAVPEPAAH